ncbi:MAG: AI-2E family transporter [Patescibacteria group bacterium]|jgi:predicted PurR-regulated permease PerM|nr:AI-2E family transporter [Patescibacteria group bacterium]
MIFKKSTPLNKNVVITAAILAFIGLLLFLQDYFILIALAAILAFLMNPIYKWIIRKRGGKEGFAITGTVLALFAIIVIPITIIMAITATQAVELVNQIESAGYNGSSLSKNLDTLVANINEQADKLPFVDGQAISVDQIKQMFQDAASSIVSATIAFIKSFAGGIANFFTMLIIFLFVFSSMLKNQNKIIKALEDINPLGKEMNSRYIDKMGAMTTAMVKGQFAIALAQGLSSTLSLWIVGIDYLAFFFVILTFLSIIPLGGGIIIIPLGIVLILTGNIWQGVLLLAWHFLITTNIDNILRPKFVPKSARLDPALTILSVFAGIGIFGFLGIVIGPVLMIVLLTTLSMYLDYKKYGNKLPPKPSLSKS